MDPNPISITTNTVDDNTAPTVEKTTPITRPPRAPRTPRTPDDPNNPDALRTVCETGDVACRFTDAYYCHYRSHTCKFGFKCHSMRYTEAQVTNHMSRFHKDIIAADPDTPSQSMIKKLERVGRSKKQNSPPESLSQVVVSAPVAPLPAQRNNVPASAQTDIPRRRLNRSNSVTTPRVANNDQKRNAYASNRNNSFRKSFTSPPLIGIHGISGIQTDQNTMDVHALATMNGKCIELVKTKYAATVTMVDGTVILMHHLPCSGTTYGKSEYCYHHFLMRNKRQGQSVPQSTQFL